jgi:hypothetical protein
MLKVIIGLLFGAGIGGFAGFYYTETIYKEKLKTIETAKELSVLELSTCTEQKTKFEKQFLAADAELKLNETRSCFVTSATLEAPEFIPPDVEAIRSDSSGNVILNWKAVKGAKKYIVKIEGEDGTEVNTTEVEGEPMMHLNRITSASKLEAAQYFVRLSAVNGLEQEGKQSERKPIQFSSVTFKAQPKKNAKSKKR